MDVILFLLGLFAVIFIAAHIEAHYADKHRNDPEKILERIRYGCATKEEEDLFNVKRYKPKKEQQVDEANEK